MGLRWTGKGVVGCASKVLHHGCREQQGACMRYFTLVASIVVFSMLSGCATTDVALTVHSQPEGAYITDVESGQGYGIAPVTIDYDLSGMTKDANGCYSLAGVHAQWTSGAQAEYEAITYCGNGTSVLISRDPSAPGLDQDLQFAAQLAQTRAEQQEAQAASDANLAAALSMFSGAVQNYKNNELQQQYQKRQQYQAQQQYPTLQEPALPTLPSLPNSGQPATAFWTGQEQQITTITHQQGWNCQYTYAGQTFWRAYVGTCPASIAVQ